jgi:hypothetical protein
MKLLKLILKLECFKKFCFIQVWYLQDGSLKIYFISQDDKLLLSGNFYTLYVEDVNSLKYGLPSYFVFVIRGFHQFCIILNIWED